MKRLMLLALLLIGTCVCSAQTSRISLSELPKQAQTFLKQHYKNRPVQSIRRDASATPYQVMLAQGTRMTFAENGDWCEIDGDGASLPMSMVPENVAKYVNKTYPRKRIKLLTKGPDSIGVNLSGNVALKFDSDGKILM